MILITGPLVFLPFALSLPLPSARMGLICVRGAGKSDEVRAILKQTGIPFNYRIIYNIAPAHIDACLVLFADALMTHYFLNATLYIYPNTKTIS